MRTCRTVIAAACRGLLLVGILSHCTSASRPGLPQDSPFAPVTSHRLSTLKQGVAVGDVTSQSAQIWLRTEGPATVRIEWGPEEAWRAPVPNGNGRSRDVAAQVIHTLREKDYTAILALDGLAAATRYRYRVRIMDEDSPDRTTSSRGRSLSGRFATAPPDELYEPVTFVWSSDLGGQGHCREGRGTYRIFEAMRKVRPAFAVLLGDLVYSDEACPSPPNVSGSDFVASTLADFRKKHRYQREDPALQDFLAVVPVYVIWDDHEVRNNFSGPNEPLMPVGRQALLEYWPIRTPETDSHRLYRRVRYGADLELFILDTRQYRSRNSERDRPGKTMLGQAQLDWLLEGLIHSTATWKVIATSVPLSVRKGDTLLAPGNDSWARGSQGTGFHLELRHIVDAILNRRIRNVIWLAGDVHYAQVNGYDPDRDGVTDYHEFISGPLSAEPQQPQLPLPGFGPTTFYSGGGFLNFGVLTVDRSTATVKIINQTGAVSFGKTFLAR